MVSKVEVWPTLICVAPFLPVLVVIINAPLDASEPYSAAAPAPFSTWISSISSGFKFPKMLLGTITLSTTTSAWLFPNKERLPRSTKRTAGLTPELTAFTCKPATLPESAAATLAPLPWVNSLAFTVVAWLPCSRRWMLTPPAVTTTSLRLVASLSNLTVPTLLLAGIATSFAVKPKKEIVKVLPDVGTLNENLPSTPVTTVTAGASFTFTDAPGIGDPSSLATTVPVTNRS
ncbi:hypothetical protein D9M68_656990 [compost metagenome]